MIHNRAERDARQLDRLRVPGGERAAFVGHELLTDRRKGRPNLGVLNGRDEPDEAQEGSERVRSRIGHRVDLEKTNVGLPMFPREAHRKGDRPGTQGVLARLG